MKDTPKARPGAVKDLKADMIWGVIWVALGIFAILYSMPYAEVPSFDPIGAAYLPRLLGSGTSILGLGLFIDSYFKFSNLLRTVKVESSERDGPQSSNYQGAVRILLSIIACVCYIALIEPLGYILTTPAFITAIMTIYGESNKKRIAAMAVGMTAALYAIFALGLKVLLPPGIFEGILQ